MMYVKKCGTQQGIQKNIPGLQKDMKPLIQVQTPFLQLSVYIMKSKNILNQYQQSKERDIEARIQKPELIDSQM